MVSARLNAATSTGSELLAGTTTTLLEEVCSDTGSWVQVTSGALSAGHSVTLTLSNYEKSATAIYNNYTLFDNVQLNVN